MPVAVSKRRRRGRAEGARPQEALRFLGLERAGWTAEEEEQRSPELRSRKG